MGIKQAIAECQACPLWEQLEPMRGRRHCAVPGEGPALVDIMVIGEAPGVEEAHQGVPLIGASGRRFNMLLQLAHLDRAELFVTNLVKHRPPKNRDPYVKEIKACAPFLDEQIDSLQPRVVITLGRLAAKYFHPKVKITNDHGKPRQAVHNGHNFTLIPMYHPAAGLRDPNLWAVCVGDWQRLPDILREVDNQPEPVPTYYRLATHQEALAVASTQRTLGFDLETTSPRRGKYFAVQEADIVGYSVAWAPGYAVYTGGRPHELSWILESTLYEKIAHNAKFEYGQLARIGITMRNFQDTKLAAWLLQKHSSHLKALSRQMLDRDPITYDQVTQGRDMADIPLEEVVEYGAADSDSTRMLWPTLKRELTEAKLWDVYEKVELPAIPVLHDMENKGVLVDVAAALEVLSDIDQAIEVAQEDIYQAGLPRSVSVTSTEQLSGALEKLGAPITARTEAKKLLKTDETALEEAKAKGFMSDLVDSLLGYKSLVKTRAYIKSYVDLRGPDGRLHPQFVQAGEEEDRGTASDTDAGPRTGRLSCRGPNLQNQPNRKGGDWTPRLRRCVLPTPGYQLVAGDISQEEVRIAAYVTGERRFLEAIRTGGNVYEVFAEGIYNKKVTKSSDPMAYNIGKQSVLSFIWGSEGSRSWAPRLLELDKEQGTGELTLAAAKRAYSRLEKEFPDIPRWRQYVKETLYDKGYITDYFGRRRLLPGVYSMDRNQANAAWREGMNFLIQGPAGSVIKLAKRRVWEAIQGKKAFLLLSIHDELVGEAAPEEIDNFARLLYTMTVDLMPIELPVEVKVGPNWAEMRDYQ